MLIDLTGKTALVTGSTEGIGFAAAKGLAQAGGSVIVNGRSQEKVDAAVARIGETKGAVRGIVADLADASGVDALIAALPQADILVNNAGIFQAGDFFDTDDATWDRHWQINVMAGVRLSRHYLPRMEAKSGAG